jgi:hypothetical protein
MLRSVEFGWRHAAAWAALLLALLLPFSVLAAGG